MYTSVCYISKWSNTSQVHNHTLLATFRQIFSEKEAGVKDSTAKLPLGDNGTITEGSKWGHLDLCVCVKETCLRVSFFC